MLDMNSEPEKIEEKQKSTSPSPKLAEENYMGKDSEQPLIKKDKIELEYKYRNGKHLVFQVCPFTFGKYSWWITCPLLAAPLL